MINALFGFDDVSSGERAAANLRDAGLPADAVSVHANESITKHATSRGIDEQVTGGLLTNLSELFKGIFEWGESPHADASAYEETVRRGGIVVSVSVQSDEDRDRVDSLMQSADFIRRTPWRDSA
jgi:hypothetical protein